MSTLSSKELKKDKLDKAITSSNASATNSNILLINHKQDFDSILKESGDRMLLIEFFANWCGPCRMLASKLQELAKFYNGKILIIKIDVDDFEDIALEYNVSAMPTFMIMKNQMKLEQFSSSNLEVLEKTLEKYIETQ